MIELNFWHEAEVPEIDKSGSPSGDEDPNGRPGVGCRPNPAWEWR